jgi:PAS domain S-box-containing protein
MDADTPCMSRAQMKHDFFHSLGGPEQLLQLFSTWPGVAFFAKDHQFRIVAANRAFWERLGCRSEDELIGQDDFSLFPQRLAENFRRDDAEVLATGRAKLKIIELFFNRQGLPDWFVTNKFPVHDASGQPCGIIGTVEGYGDRGPALSSDGQLDAAVEWIRGHFRGPISISDLSKVSGLSSRHFHRRFSDVFGVSPQTFLVKTRVQAACEALRQGRNPIADIATDCGFYDQSSFTSHFRRHMGVTPRLYREGKTVAEPT